MRKGRILSLVLCAGLIVQSSALAAPVSGLSVFSEDEASAYIAGAFSHSSEAVVSDGADVTEVILGSGADFSLYTLPQLTDSSLVADGYEACLKETFPSGLSSFVLANPVSGESLNRYGLIDEHCQVLLQPDYIQIYALTRITGALGPGEDWTSRESFPNLLVLVDESYKYHVYSCKTREIVGGSYDFVGDADSYTMSKEELLKNWPPISITQDSTARQPLCGMIPIPAPGTMF